MRALLQALPLIPLLAFASGAQAQAVEPPLEQAAEASDGEVTGSEETSNDLWHPPPPRLWLEAEVGISSMDMGDFAFAYGGYGSQLVPRTDDGLALQGALGGRFRWLTVGARAGSSRYSAYAVNVVGGEVGFQWPMRWVEPRIQLHGGYAWHGDADIDLQSPGLAGPAFGGGVGLRVPLKYGLVVGLSFDMDLMWLSGSVRLASEGPGVDPMVNAALQRLIDLGLAPTDRGQGWQLRTLLTLGVAVW